MLCTPPSAVVSIRPAVDATHAGSGRVVLANGASFEIGLGHGPDFVNTLRMKDRVEICYAPPQKWADEPENARMALVVNTRIAGASSYLYTVAIPPERHGRHVSGRQQQ